jgi:hypothetical protein
MQNNAIFEALFRNSIFASAFSDQEFENQSDLPQRAVFGDT